MESDLNGSNKGQTSVYVEQPTTSEAVSNTELSVTSSLTDYTGESLPDSTALEDMSASDQPMSSGQDTVNQRRESIENSEDGDNTSEISDISDLSTESWQPVHGPMSWVQEQMRQGKSPRKILEDLVPSDTMIPDGLDPFMLWKIIINIVSEPPKRKKLQNINTLEDVLGLLKSSQKIIVLTGAGVSVSCGIPDFRSRDGVYSRLAKDFPNLPDPQAMFDIHFFRNDPRPFFKFAKEIYPGQFKPSLCHNFIKLVEEKGKLLRNYTQNIDTLEQVAGIQNAVQCHGSFASATCTVCGMKVDSDVIKADIVNQVIPRCPKCSPSLTNAVMKPDIVFFGESLPEHFHNQMAIDKDQCDLLIVIGSSLKVRPVALIPNSLPADVPQVLINRERLQYMNFDVELLGNCDDIVGDLCRRLGPGWDQLAPPGSVLTEVSLSALPTPPLSPLCEESGSSPLPSTSDHTGHSPSCTKSTEPPVTDTSKPTTHHHKASAVSEQQITSTTSSVNLSKTVLESESECREQHKQKTESLYEQNHSSDSHFNSLKRPFSAIASPSKNNLESVSDPMLETISDPVTPSCSSVAVEETKSAQRTPQCFCKDSQSLDKECSCEKITDDQNQETNAKRMRLKPLTLPDNDGSSEDDKDIRKLWQNKVRISLATRLADDQVLYLPPSRYVFKGAEVFSDEDSDESEGENEQENDSSSSNSDSEDEQSNTGDLNINASSESSKEPDVEQPSQCVAQRTEEIQSDCVIEVSTSHNDLDTVCSSTTESLPVEGDDVNSNIKVCPNIVEADSSGET